MSSRNAAKKKIRILIADREGIFRLGLRNLFALEDDLRVVAQAGTAPQTIALAKSARPHLLFIQAEIMTEGGDNLIANVRREAPECKVVVMPSTGSGEDDALKFLDMGASGVILKSVEPSQFVKCAHKVVLENVAWLPKQLGVQMASLQNTNVSRPLRPVDTLTRREKTIISALMRGWRNREIAEHLSITEQTVKNHLRSVFDKVGVSDRLELVLYAIHQRMELPPVQPNEPGGSAQPST